MNASTICKPYSSLYTELGSSSAFQPLLLLLVLLLAAPLLLLLLLLSSLTLRRDRSSLTRPECAGRACSVHAYSAVVCSSKTESQSHVSILL
jgi:hypothetical protein